MTDPTVFERVVAEQLDPIEDVYYSRRPDFERARHILHALATSDEVGAALVTIADMAAIEARDHGGEDLEFIAAQRTMEAILAAIDPETPDA